MKKNKQTGPAEMMEEKELKVKGDFSLEFQNTFVEILEKFEEIRGDVEEFKNDLTDINVPIRRYDRNKVGGEDMYPVDQSFVTRATKYLEPFLKNLDENDENDPALLIKNIGGIYESLDWLYKKFHTFGYAGDHGDGGDILSQDFPAISKKLDHLLQAMSNIILLNVSLENRLGAHELYDEIEDPKKFFQKQDFISMVRYASSDGKVRWNSVPVGMYRTSDELIQKVTHYLETVVPVKNDPQKRAAQLGFQQGLQEFLDEFQAEKLQAQKNSVSTEKNSVSKNVQNIIE